MYVHDRHKLSRAWLSLCYFTGALLLSAYCCCCCCCCCGDLIRGGGPLLDDDARGASLPARCRHAPLILLMAACFTETKKSVLLLRLLLLRQQIFTICSCVSYENVCCVYVYVCVYAFREYWNVNFEFCAYKYRKEKKYI